jgi:hypothetical protein
MDAWLRRTLELRLHELQRPSGAQYDGGGAPMTAASRRSVLVALCSGALLVQKSPY